MGKKMMRMEETNSKMKWELDSGGGSGGNRHRHNGEATTTEMAVQENQTPNIELR